MGTLPRPLTSFVGRERDTGLAVLVRPDGHVARGRRAGLDLIAGYLRDLLGEPALLQDDVAISGS